MTAHLVGRNPDITSEIVRHYLGKMKVECTHCKALLWIDERNSVSKLSPTFQLCCEKGQYVFQPFPATPTVIGDMLKGSNVESAESKKMFELTTMLFRSLLLLLSWAPLFKTDKTEHMHFVFMAAFITVWVLL